MEKLVEYLQDENLVMLFRRLEITNIKDLKNITYEKCFENNFDSCTTYQEKEFFFDYLKQDSKLTNEFLDFLKENELEWSEGYKAYFKSYDIGYSFYNFNHMSSIMAKIDHIYNICSNENIVLDFDQINAIIDICFKNDDYSLNYYKKYIETFLDFYKLKSSLKHNNQNIKIKGVKI